MKELAKQILVFSPLAAIILGWLFGNIPSIISEFRNRRRKP